jgi:hypothetical protein
MSENWISVPYPLPAITDLQESPELRLDNYPESEMEVRLYSGHPLLSAINICKKKGAAVSSGGILYIPLVGELAAWAIFTSPHFAILRRHISTICIDQRLQGEDAYSWPWAVAFGDIVCRSEGTII